MAKTSIQQRDPSARAAQAPHRVPVQAARPPASYNAAEPEQSALEDVFPAAGFERKGRADSAQSRGALSKLTEFASTGGDDDDFDDISEATAEWLDDQSAFEPLTAQLAAPAPDTALRRRRVMSKAVGGTVRPQTTRRSQPARIARLDPSKSLSVAAALAAGAAGPNFSEFEEVIGRMVDRIVKFLQAEKCVFLLHDSERGDLYAVAPARGITGEQIARFRCPADGEGLSAWVYTHAQAVVLGPGEVEFDARAIADGLAEHYEVGTALSVPLFIERRGDDNQVIETETIGVAHVFNKSTGQGFSDKDRSLLEAMSRNAASIFNSARAFREVVYEKQELIQTLDSLYVGLMMVGLDGRVIQINPAARAVLEIGADEAVAGLKYGAVVKNGSFTAVLAKALAGLDPVETTGEVTARSGHEERIYQAHCAPVKDQDNKNIVGVLVLLNDVTEIRGVDRMKTAFISTVSHELRTPLTSIKGFVATLRDDKTGFYSEGDKQEFYEIIDNECDRLTRLIEDLLNVSRIEQGRAMQLNLQQVDIPTLVTKVLTTQRAYTSPDRHLLDMQFPSDFPPIEADPDKIDQILTNLVNNAIKYSPRGGPVLVTGGVGPTASTIYISVCDQGMGIPREHVKKVWDRFHRVDNRDNREIGGTGIGLFLVKALAEAHGGTVGIESEVGRGSIFTVTLPIVQPVDMAGA